jgi:hypothetical protein
MVIKMKLLLMFVFVANSSLNPMIAFAEDRPRPNVITGGNPRQRDVPWPTQSRSNEESLHTHLYGTLDQSTFYQRASRKVYYKGYARFYQSCAAHRSGVYSYGRR